jgi:hypothetical protein
MHNHPFEYYINFVIPFTKASRKLRSTLTNERYRRIAGIINGECTYEKDTKGMGRNQPGRYDASG